MKNYIAKICLILISMICFQCNKKEAAKEEILKPVKFIVLGSNPSDQTRTFTGTAKAGNEIELSFRDTGIIERVNVKKGQRIKKGDLIASLDNLEANLNYERAVIEVNSTESGMNTSKAELERVKTLYEKGSAPLKDYQSAKNNYQNALSQFEAAKRNLEIQRSRISYGIIYSPSDGIIAKTSGKENERVPAGHVFAILNAGDKKKVGMELPENIINQVTIGLKVDIEFSTLPDVSFAGNVIEVSPITSSNAATYPVDIEINNPSEQIRPGMSANVTFNFSSSNEQQENTIIVPIKAVGEDSKGNFVFLIETEDNLSGVAIKTKVEIGDITATGFEIKSGLQLGQIIATAGLQTLLDGQKVKLN